MSYLKMLGLARGKLGGAQGLFSTAVISGSSSAPNLRVMIPTASNSNTALEGFGGVPAIRPLETLHNALSLRQLDDFLERVTEAPVLLGTPPSNPAPVTTAKQPSPTSSVGWSGPSSLMSSSGELPSGLSSAGPSSPNSNYASNSEHKNNSSESSNWSRHVAGKAPDWGEPALRALTCGLRALVPPPAGSSISGDVTPVSLTSEPEFHSNEATAGSITDHDLLSAEGEDDEETLSVDTCGSPVRVIRNDLTPQNQSKSTFKIDREDITTAPLDLYGLSFQQTKENFYKEMPSSSKNLNVDSEKNKCAMGRLQYASNIDSLNLQSSKFKIKQNEILNNGCRRYSDSSAQKRYNNSHTVSASRFTTTLVDEDLLRAGTSGDKKSLIDRSQSVPNDIVPVVSKAKPIVVKPGFTINENEQV